MYSSNSAYFELMKHADIHTNAHNVLNVEVLWWLLVVEIHVCKYDLLSFIVPCIIKSLSVP